MTEPTAIEAIDCLTGCHVLVDSSTGSSIVTSDKMDLDVPFIGPGLVDLQINGVNGVDFNNPSITDDHLIQATHYLLSQGVTTFFPTIITNSDHLIIQLLTTIGQACQRNNLLSQCIGGIHLEGPFISKVDGARGAHPLQHVKAPDWALFSRFQKASGNRIKIITLSPEWKTAPAFITQCRKSGVRVSIGHSLATPEQLNDAVAAGATMSTHLGNAVPLMLPRHPNIIWEQLAQDPLYTSLIADGFHLPDSFIKVVMKVKGDKCLIVSDGTWFTGMKPGLYSTHIGGKVKLESNGRLSMEDGNGLLAGATKTLLMGIEYLVGRGLATVEEAWRMASVYPRLVVNCPSAQLQSDKVVFTLSNGRFSVARVFKNNELVYLSKTFRL